MPSSTKSASASATPIEEPQVTITNPGWSSFLAWLVPGLGHWYQGRYPKAILFFCCIMPLLLGGCYLGSDSEYGIARNVYYSWRRDDKRLFFIPQACVGILAIPSIIQSITSENGSPVFGKFMSPPHRYEGDKSGSPPTLDAIVGRLNNSFDIGTLFTVAAGLMNLLVIFDAAAGPMVYDTQEKKKEEGQEKL